MSIDAHSGIHYALLGRCRYIDALKWFRDEGEAQFPSIALLARIHLGNISSSGSHERTSGKTAAAAGQQGRSREDEAGRAQDDRLKKEKK
ncbi:hypothetical protein JG687_00005418 [Phytophthora cactorum]|uniref:Uncharacterized protein n=1 Tax=Phytophthora cactorum TaxID=29920 RepID=A0A8T1UQK3_9STRA|nr:hypothetical protein JG687_00005418 [Phytophthora cactorum]